MVQGAPRERRQQGAPRFSDFDATNTRAVLMFRAKS